jgi:hypothetical protein
MLAKEVRTMRHPHIVDQDWENSLLLLLGVFFIGLVGFGLIVAGF